MTDYSVLKRLAEAANAVTGDVSVDIAISSERGPNQDEIDAVTAFVGAATPAAVLALIAENERNQRMVLSACMSMGAIGESLGLDMDSDGDEMLGMVAELKAERDQLRAEISGLKTGYEAYERANAELKAEVEGLRKDADRLQSATAFVQKLCDSAGKQPSVATGYLHDILSALGQGEQS